MGENGKVWVYACLVWGMPLCRLLRPVTRLGSDITIYDLSADG